MGEQRECINTLTLVTECLLLFGVCFFAEKESDVYTHLQIVCCYLVLVSLIRERERCINTLTDCLLLLGACFYCLLLLGACFFACLSLCLFG